MGTPALTTRGFTEKDFVKVAEFVDRAVQIAVAIKAKVAGKKLQDFKDHLEKSGELPEIKKLREDVEAFATSFPTVGYDKGEARYTKRA